MDLIKLEVIEHGLDNVVNSTTGLSIPQFNTICRTCLTQGDHKPFFEIMHKEKSASEILSMCTTLQIKKEDNLPQNVCCSCFTDILHLYTFFQKCQESEAVLRYIVNLQGSVKTPRKDEEAVVVDFINSCTQADIANDGSDVVNGIFDDANDTFDIDLLQSKKKKEVQRKTVHTKKKIVAKTSEPRFTCKSCGEQFEEYKLFMGHRRDAKHPVVRTRITCTLCTKAFTSNRIAQHMRSHTKEKPYICKLCSMGFSVAGNLKRHMMIHTGERPHVCEFCGKGFIQSPSLLAHKNTHTDSTLKTENPTGDKNELPFSCEYCGRLFKRLGRYNAHLKKHESDTGEISESFVKHDVNDGTHDNASQYSCRVCGRAYKTKQYLKAHERLHGEKSYLCCVCGKGFVSNAYLQTHLKTHTGEKPYSCNICKKTFAQFGSYGNHMLIHTGTKPYQCRICARSFTQVSHLKHHLRTHSGERPYSCFFCNKTFALNGNLTVHVRTHTGETPYICGVCGKGFYDSSSMKKHRRGHHDGAVEIPPVNVVVEKCSDHTYISMFNL